MRASRKHHPPQALEGMAEGRAAPSNFSSKILLKNNKNPNARGEVGLDATTPGPTKTKPVISIYAWNAVCS